MGCESGEEETFVVTEAPMTYDTPYEDIVKDAIADKQIVVFCDSQRSADDHKKAIAATARRLGAKHVVAPRRDRRVDIDNSVVRLILANGIDGRGIIADVVYLSRSARMQHEYVALMQATVK